jgi:pyridoxine 4-dehydrogenase
VREERSGFWININVIRHFKSQFSPLQSSALSEVSAALDVSPLQIALAWLLRRSPNILLVPDTSSVAHLHDNIAAAETMTKLNGIATTREQ